jgi:hypothetical protein
LLASDRAAWLARNTEPPARVRLVRINPSNRHQVTALSVHQSQRDLVPSVRDQLLEFFIPPVENGVELSLQVRGIEADGTIVGMLVLQETTAANPDPDLRWILVDRWHQRRGIGAAAIRLAASYERNDLAQTLWARWPVDLDEPRAFFEAIGFAVTGTVDGVVEARLDLDASRA